MMTILTSLGHPPQQKFHNFSNLGERLNLKTSPPPRFGPHLQIFDFFPQCVNPVGGEG